MKIASAPTGPGQANTYIADDEHGKCFIVDPGGYVNDITQYIKEREFELEYIVLTHGHGDHIGGVDGYKKDFPDVKIVAHKDEYEMLHDPEMNFTRMMFGKPVTVDADIYVSEGDTLKCGEIEMKFFHTPGHSPGGMCILCEKVLFSGDTLFQQSIGRTDFDGSNYDDLIKSIKEKIFKLPDDTQVLPGHMGPTNIGAEKEHNPFV